MSRFYCLDIETIPLPEDQLLKLMPPSMVNPIIPEEIRNPQPPDLSKCPVYGGDVDKQDAWKQKKIADHAVATENARSTWEERQIEAKQKFIDDAALSPVTGTVKLIGIKDVNNGVAHILICEATEKEQKALGNAEYPCKIQITYFLTEKSMLSFLSDSIGTGAVVIGESDVHSDFRLVSFFGNGFDFPFIFKRCWITGAKAPGILRKGRYWNDAISCDLHELFTFGDRSQKTGGLDNVAKILGTKRKTGTGEAFYRIWDSDPIAAVLYLIDDLQVTYEAGLKMGAIYLPSKGMK